MLHRLVLPAAACAFLALAAPALAQTACQGAGDPAAIPLNSHTAVAAQDTQLGLTLGRLASPATQDKVGRDIPCTRGATFRAGLDDYTLTGQDSDDLPRRAVTQRAAAPTYFLAPFDHPGRPNAKTYALIQMTGGRSAAAWRLFTAIPSDDVLKIAIQDIAASTPKPIAGYDGARNQVFVAQAQVSPPAAGAAQLPPGVRTMTQPDGTIFVATPGGGALHRASGFTCPAAFLGFARRDITIYDAANNGRDVGCGYGPPGASSWYTLYLTNIPNITQAQIFQLWTQQAQVATPVAAPAPPPLAPGVRPLPNDAAFWTDRMGRIQGLWVSSIGNWRVNLRTTLSPGKEAEAADMARTIFAAFYSQVDTVVSLAEGAETQR